VVDSHCLGLDDGDGLVLLFYHHGHLHGETQAESIIHIHQRRFHPSGQRKNDENTHVVEQLSELGQSLLDPLNVLVTLLDLLVRRVGLAVPIALEELEDPMDTHIEPAGFRQPGETRESQRG
jgi:hypothetical protein